MHRLRRFALFALLLGLLLIVGVIGVLMGRMLNRSSGPRMLNTVAVVQQIQTLSQLITIQYVVEKVVQFEDVKWYGENSVLLVAHGIVKAGIDLSKLSPKDVTITGTKIRLTIPSAGITDAYLDDSQTKVIERKTGLLRQFDKDLEQSARAIAVDDVRRAARLGGIVTEANSRARLQLTALLRQMGFTEVEIK